MHPPSPQPISPLLSCYLIHQHSPKLWSTKPGNIDWPTAPSSSAAHFFATFHTVLFLHPVTSTQVSDFCLDNCHCSSLASASCHWAQFSTRQGAKGLPRPQLHSHPWRSFISTTRIKCWCLFTPPINTLMPVHNSLSTIPKYKRLWKWKKLELMWW